jgi:hypothetical protein
VEAKPFLAQRYGPCGDRIVSSCRHWDDPSQAVFDRYVCVVRGREH